MQAGKLEAAFPADPTVAEMGGAAHGPADGPERAEAVMRLHQLVDSRLVLFPGKVDRCLRRDPRPGSRN